jgi:hypothetical protein
MSGNSILPEGLAFSISPVVLGQPQPYTSPLPTAPLTVRYPFPLAGGCPAFSRDDGYRTLMRRAEEVRALSAPSTLRELLHRGSDCIADLREILQEDPNAISAQDKDDLDKIDGHISGLRSIGSGDKGAGSSSGGNKGGGGGGGSGGGGGNGAQPPASALPKVQSSTQEKAWYSKLAEVAALLCQKLFALIKGAATAFAAGLVGHAPPKKEAQSMLARVWSDFWFMAGKIVAGIATRLAGDEAKKFFPAPAF